MSSILIENRPVARAEIDGAGVLSSELTTQLDQALDQTEDLGPGSIMFVHLVGQVTPAGVQLWPGRTDIQSVTRWERVLRRIERTNSATIVLGERACSGLALELMLVADRRLAANDFSVHFTASGSAVWPGMSLYRLSRQIGESQARKLFLDASDVAAERALELHIVDAIVEDVTNGGPSGPLLTYAPSDDFPVRRRLMQDSLSTSFDDALGTHLAACDRAMRRSSNY